MENFIYSLNATLPVFLVIVVGYILKRVGWIGDEFVKSSNKINFRVTLPALLIQDLMKTDFKKYFDAKYIAFCSFATLISIFVTWFLAKRLLKDKDIVGEFVQASYRSSAAVLGAALAINIYGNVGMVPLMIIGAVPLYNIFAVIILTVESPDKENSKADIKSTLISIITNPIIVGIILGTSFSLLGVKFPLIIDNTITNFSKIATPLALIAIGGGFEFNKVLGKIRPTLIATFTKLVVWAIFFMPFAINLGFRGGKLMAIIIMLGSPTTPSCYIMAKSMKSEGSLTSGVVVLTTYFSAFTITALIFIAKSMGYL